MHTTTLRCVTLFKHGSFAQLSRYFNVNLRKVSTIPSNNIGGKSLSTAAQAKFSEAAKMPGIKRIVSNVIKSEQDKRDYRALELENGMKVLLISDPETDISAAAMDVNCGHLCDPWELPGLAHFCEHMLFMGTEKVISVTRGNYLD